jgi:peptidoglycan hydrolase-like protein with peptidoglycan-binding domain
MKFTGIAPAARWGGALIALALTLIPASPAVAETRLVSASQQLLIPAAGWHGRPIQHPHRHTVRTASADDRPAGWQAGPVALGTGTHRPSGSRRVREVQRRLVALGYRPGPIDGIFGVRTRAAVAWFQVKHAFHVDGRATLGVVRHLRDRTSPGRNGGGRRLVDDPRPSGPSWEAFRGLVSPGAAAPAAESGGPPFWSLAGVLLLAFAVGFAGVALLQRSRRPATAPPLAAPALAAAPRALGYARVGSEKRVKAHATTIAARCADHGMALTGMITDDDADDRPGRDRPGLGFALRQMQSGEADCLVVGRIGHLTRSPAELMELLEVMSERETPLVVLNADPGARRRTGRWSGGGDAARTALERRRLDA